MKKDKLIKKYDKYIQLLGEVGGALTIDDFLYLFNVKYKNDIENGKMRSFNYDKIARDFRNLNKLLDEKDNDFELLNVYKSVVEKKVGVPSNVYIMCLTSKGWWYYNKTRRGEVKFENPDIMRKIRFNAYRRIVKADSFANHKANVEKILTDYNDIPYEVSSVWKDPIEPDKILSSNKFLLESIRFFEGDDMFQSIYSIKVTYFEDTLVYRNLCETLDMLLGLLERTCDLFSNDSDGIFSSFSNNGRLKSPAQIFIELECITTNKANISKFTHYRNKYYRKYAYYDYVHRKKLPKNFRSFFGKNIKRINFYTIDSKYNLTKY